MKRPRKRRELVILAALALLLAIALRGVLRQRPGADSPDPPQLRDLRKGDAALLETLRRRAGKGLRILEARVIEAIDGDTIELAGGDRVRYLGIDSPERSEAYHLEARRLNRRLVEGRGAVIAIPEPGSRDRYRRLLGAVFVSDRSRPDGAGEGAGEGAVEDGGAGEWILAGAELIRAGLARVYIVEDDPVTAAIRPALVESQRRALDLGLGAWAAPRPDGEVLITRNRFHRRGCPEIPATIAATLQRDEALRSGRSPCRTCKP